MCLRGLRFQALEDRRKHEEVPDDEQYRGDDRYLCERRAELMAHMASLPYAASFLMSSL